MKKLQSKYIFKILFAIVLTLGLSISLQSLVRAWSSPTEAPPSANVQPPIYNAGTIPYPIVDKDLVVSQHLTVNDNFYVGVDSFHINRATGNVGIGALANDKRLSISAPIGNNAELSIKSSGAIGSHWGIYHDETSSELRFWKDAVNVLKLTPSSAEVAGKVRSDSTLASDPANTVATKDYVDAQVGGSFSGAPAAMCTLTASNGHNPGLCPTGFTTVYEYSGGLGMYSVVFSIAEIGGKCHEVLGLLSCVLSVGIENQNISKNASVFHGPETIRVCCK